MFAFAALFSLSAAAMTPPECVVLEMDMHDHIRVAEKADSIAQIAEERLQASNWLYETREIVERDLNDIIAQRDALLASMESTGGSPELEEAILALELAEAEAMNALHQIDDQLFHMERAVERSNFVADEAFRNLARIEAIFNRCLADSSWETPSL